MTKRWYNNFDFVVEVTGATIGIAGWIATGSSAAALIAICCLVGVFAKASDSIVPSPHWEKLTALQPAILVFGILHSRDVLSAPSAAFAAATTAAFGLFWIARRQT